MIIPHALGLILQIVEYSGPKALKHILNFKQSYVANFINFNANLAT